MRRLPGSRLVWIAVAVVVLIGAVAAVMYHRHRRSHFARFVPTEPDVVEVMLELAEVRAGDVVYDLGCGDGRLVIRALQAGAARGVCVDIDPVRMFDAQIAAQQAGVVDRFRFVIGDARKQDLADATVVFLYLSRELNLEIAPALPRGARVISHWHDMGPWPPDRTVQVDGSRFGRRPVYKWIVR